MKNTVRLLIVFGTFVLVRPAFAHKRWTKLNSENCALLLSSMRSRAITVDDIISESDAQTQGQIEDCGPGCYEYTDWSHASIPANQAANERTVAAAYAESLLAKGEGLFLFSRYQGIDVPAYDGLTFMLDTGEITSRVTLKRGFKSENLLDQAFVKTYKYSWRSGRWPELTENMARLNPPRGLSYAQAVEYLKPKFDKIGRWMLIDDQRIKTRVVLMQPHRRTMSGSIPGYAKRLLAMQTGNLIESVILLEDEQITKITFD